MGDDRGGVRQDFGRRLIAAQMDRDGNGRLERSEIERFVRNTVIVGAAPVVLNASFDSSFRVDLLLLTQPDYERLVRNIEAVPEALGIVFPNGKERLTDAQVTELAIDARGKIELEFEKIRLQLIASTILGEVSVGSYFLNAGIDQVVQENLPRKPKSQTPPPSR